jgi:hypothetical protein
MSRYIIGYLSTIEIDDHNSTKKKKTQMENYSRWGITYNIYMTYVVDMYFLYFFMHITIMLFLSVCNVLFLNIRNNCLKNAQFQKHYLHVHNFIWHNPWKHFFTCVKNHEFHILLTFKKKKQLKYSWITQNTQSTQG